MSPEPNRRDPEKHKDQLRRGAAARYAATRELIRRHQAEYDELHTHFAAERGVTPDHSRRRKENPSC